MAITDATIADQVRDQVAALGPDKTCCPSDIARALADSADWRELMPRVRAVAAELATAGEIVVTQKGEAVDIASAKGPVRLGTPRS